MERTAGLYFIYDKLSEMRITGFLEMPNDAVAAKSFVTFLSDKKDDKHLFDLYCLCKIDEDNIFGREAHIDPYIVCEGAHVEEDFRAIMDKRLRKAIEEEE